MPGSTNRPVAARVHHPAPARVPEPKTTGGQRNTAFILLLVAVNAMAVLPNGVKYLYVQHRPLDLLGERGLAPEFPLARVFSAAGAVALLLVCAAIVVGRRKPDRNVFALILLLVALLVPYIISPTLPDMIDLVRILLTTAVVVTVWIVGPHIDVLRWVPVAGAVIGMYSIIGGLILPEYMNNITDPGKLVIPDWQLAGPFWHGNVLGIYSVLALALTPLIVDLRWRLLNGFILCTTIVAAASRTAMVAAAVLALWWLVCWLRTTISVRFAGTTLIGFCLAAVVMLPFLNSNPYAFVGRGYVWASSLTAWRESPLIGQGVKFVGTEYRSDPASWAFHHGHNLVVDMLVRSGLVGLCVLLLVLLAATRSTRALTGPSQQPALFGYLIAFLVISATEAIWTQALVPTLPLFPVVGFVFAVLICRDHRQSSAMPDSPPSEPTTAD